VSIRLKRLQDRKAAVARRMDELLAAAEADGREFTPAEASDFAALEAARAHAMMWGDPTYYLQPAVFDTWDEIFRNHPLYADCDNNATPGGSCANEQPAPAIARCYNNDCIQDVGFYCIDSTGSCPASFCICRPISKLKS
jgi:hypothetical protein